MSDDARAPQTNASCPSIAPLYRDDPRLQPLIGPGGMFEVEEVDVDGVVVRGFVRAPRTIVDSFELGRAHASLVHLVYDDERWTFGDVHQRSLSLARELRSSFGVCPGDRVAIAMRNLPEFIVSFWGAALVGAIVVPLNSWWTADELGYALGDCDAAVVFVDQERLERVGGASRAGSRHVVGVRTTDAEIPFDELVNGVALDESDIVRLGPDDPVTILYTSGTTGRPKGALGTNRAQMANLWNMAFVNAREAIIAGRAPSPPTQGGTLSAAPLFHIGGIAGIIGSQMGGSKMVLMRKWDVEEAIRLAQREGVTNYGGVPTMARQLLERVGVGQLGLDVRGFPLGGAAVPPDLPLRALEVFGPSIQLLNGYGSTETTSAVVTNVGVEYAARPTSVGRPNITADLRVVDPTDGRILGLGEVGELCFRSPQVVKGYWNNEEATRASFTDGWFHTGDLGYVDEDGYLYVVDRLKDVVIRGGENVYCAEVEAVLFEHPAVADVAVVGLDEHVMGERVCAVVVPRDGTAVTLADLRTFAAVRLAGFKCPEALTLVDELPKTATSKVAKNELRKALADPAAVIERAW